MIEDIYRDDVMNDNSIRKNLVEEFTDHYSISRAQMLNLYAQINEFRSKYSLKEYYEDHSVIEALESSEVTNLHQMLDFLKHKVSEKDIGLASTTAKVSANSLLNLKVRADLEKSYSEVIRQMLSTTDRETFGYSDHNNIAISTFYTENEINIDIVLSKTIFSVDNITRGNGCITIAGSLNDENYSLIALIIRDHRYEAVISPNQMSFDFYNRIYYIKFEERIYSKLKNARLLFYVKRGKNTVKYGLGSSLSHQDVTKMLNILILAYEMPLIFTDSIRHRKNNFLASAQKENINLNSKPYSVTDMRNLANSPKFNLFRGHRRSSSLTKDNRMATTKKTSRTPDLFSNASRWVFRSKQKNGNLFDCSNGKINPEDEIMKSNSGRKKFKIPSVRHTPNKQNTFFINIENPIPSPMINEASEQKLMAVSESARNKLNK